MSIIITMIRKMKSRVEPLCYYNGYYVNFLVGHHCAPLQTYTLGDL